MISKIKNFYNDNSKKITRLVSILDYFILALYGLFVAEAFLRSTTLNIDWNPYYHFSLKLILILLVLGKSLLKWSYNPGLYVLLGFTAIGFAMAYLKGSYGILLELILFTVAFTDIDFNRLLSIFTTIIGTGVIIIAISSQLGILNNLTYLTSEGKTRMALGINYPTDFAAYVLYFCLAWAFSRKEKLGYTEIALMYALGFFVFRVSHARNSSICIIILATAMLIIKLVKSLPKVLSFAAALVTPVCAAVSLGLSFFYSPDNSVMKGLDSLLSSRLSLGKETFKYYPVRLFGQHIDMVGNGGYSLSGLNHYSNGNTGYNFIDSSYMSILFRFGIFVFICVLVLFTLTTFSARKNKDYTALLIIAVIALHSVIEHHLLDLNYNPFIFLLISSYYGSKACHKADAYVEADAPSGEKKTGRRNYLRPVIITFIYGTLSIVLFFANKKEPDREIFPVAFPESKEEDSASEDTASSEKTPHIYTPYICSGDVYTQIIYTPKTVSGIELWTITQNDIDSYLPDSSSDTAGDCSIYRFSFSEPDNKTVYSVDLSVNDVTANGYTRIIFPDFLLDEGKQYNMTITNISQHSSVMGIGLVPNISPWNGGLADSHGNLQDNILCFNLVYNYHSWAYINWIILTIMFVYSIRLCIFAKA